MDLTGVKKIYFIGIGGIAMSAAAGFARQLGYEVSGSDAREIYDPAREVLDDLDVSYFRGYDANHASEAGADLYILSAGEGPENPEVKYLIERQLPYFSYSELLYELNREQIRIVVAGTHGKSTTAGLLGYCLQNIDDSSFLIGGVVKNDEQNFHSGSGHYMVFEGDEYKALFDDATPKFHYYRPDIAVLTNLEYDHPDIFSNFAELKTEFKHLLDNMPEDGLIVYNDDDVSLAEAVYGSNVASVAYGIQNDADFQVKDFKIDEAGTSFTVANKGIKTDEAYKVSLPGLINVYNALAVIACLRTLGFSHEQISPFIESFQGIKRRFEVVGEPGGITIINDYAHHPTAVAGTIRAAREHFAGRRIWAVFEPHTYSRTRATLDELAKSFVAADKVLISEIYAARENKARAGITSQDVISAVKKNHPDVRLVVNKREALSVLEKEVKSGDVVVVMAVGDFNVLAEEFNKNLQQHGN